MTHLPRILCIDDEPRVLEGMHRNLRKAFDVTTAQSGSEALGHLDKGASFDVVVSDMQMPKMNGASVLAAFRLRAPDTTRVLLTGHADLDAAIAAVNRGQVFRFLTKPCAPDDLSTALDAAVAQHRLVTAEKVLLEQTLVGSVRALSEVLALVQPQIFGPALRRHGQVRAVAEQLGVEDAWHLEVASMLALVGYVVLPGNVATKLCDGEPLDEAETAMARQVPEVVERVVACIPRLEKVREALAGYEALRAGKPLKPPGALGPQILWAVSDCETFVRKHGDVEAGLRALHDVGRHAPKIVEAVSEVWRKADVSIERLELAQMESGMLLAEDVVTEGGVLLMARGQLVTEQLLARLKNFHRQVGVVEPIACELQRIKRAPAS